MTTDLSSRNAWHKKFAQLFERIYDTGFMAEYKNSSWPLVRYIPAGRASSTLRTAWPSDRLEEILDHYDDFGVTHCQCRMTMNLVDNGCGRPMENCTSFGPMVKPMVERGLLRRVDAKEIIAIKRDAEEHGCVTWLMNAAGDPRGDGSCSCCGCCCHALRAVNEFNAPGLISRPHFMPKKIEGKCTLCKKCVRVCPMNAWGDHDTCVRFSPARCIGCGLCVVSCKAGALELSPVKDARPPESSYAWLLLKMAPGYVTNAARVFAQRMLF